MLLTKEVEVKLNGYNVNHYKNLGYDIPMKKASPEYKRKHKKEYVYDFSKPIIVSIEDLQSGSRAEVSVLCDYCNNEVLHMTYNNYNQRIKDIDKIACRKCFTQKAKEVSVLRYGVENYAKTEECQEKMRNTTMERYGVNHILQRRDFVETAKNTCVERYGKDYGKVFFDKAFDSFYQRTGYNYPSQSPEVLGKRKQTYIEHYGVDSPAKSPKVREKMAQTLYKNSSQKASTQQLYICGLYNGVLNYPIKYYNADIYLQDYNLIVEYDGGGHNLNVVTGHETQDEFKRKEIIRDSVIKREGYKQMRIISSKDLLPSDFILLQMLKHARQYFNEYPNHSWIEYDIDASTVRNAEHKDGVFYDFGELRRIKNSA